MDNILSNKGLTSSEANHFTNIVKEMVKDIDIKSSNMPLYTSKVIRDNEEYPLDTNLRVGNWVELLLRKGELYSLSAWLKSGIRLKEKLLDDVEREHHDTSVLESEFKELIVEPKKPDTSFEAFLTSLSTKERNEYLMNESIASHIGQFVHNFDTVRNSLDRFQPTTFQKVESGEVLTVKSELLYTKAEMVEGFYTLQKKHRESEKIVNYYKSKHKEWEKSVLDSHSDTISEVRNNNKNITLENNLLVSRQIELFNKAKREKKNEISNKKILIPNELQGIFDEVSKYAKL